MAFLQAPEFWIGLMKIIWINIILSGDNAVVIALAAAGLIGWVGGETMANDTILAPLMQDQHWVHQAGPVLGVALVLGLGRWLQKRGRLAAAWGSLGGRRSPPNR